MAPRTGTLAPWITESQLPDLPEAITAPMKADAIQFASDVLFQFSGRQWSGVGEDTVRPPTNWCTTGCPWELELPWFPVVSIVEVIIDGEVINPAEYRVDNARLLVRLRDAEGNRQSWPTYQDPTAHDGAEHTWSVKFTHGSSPPVGGVRSAIILSEQLARSFAPPDAGIECRLPKRITQIRRQGVDITMLDPLTLFEGGRTGIPEVDLWLGSLKAGSRERPGAVIDVAGAGPIAPRIGRYGMRSVGRGFRQSP